MPYRQLLNSFLDKHEGYSPTPYTDNNGHATIGHGFNADNGDVRGLVAAHGLDVDKIISGEQALDEDTSRQIRDSLVDKHVNLIRHTLPSFDTLPPNKQAALVSKHYQLPKNFQEIAPMVDDPTQELDAMKTMVNQNMKNPGVLKRNLETSELYGGPLGYSQMFKTMTPEQKDQITKTLGKIENENTRNEVMQKVQPYLDTIPKPQQFNRLNKLLNYDQNQSPINKPIVPESED
jgi:GH24 family phage-related lysozyme (muramidase)